MVKTCFEQYEKLSRSYIELIPLQLCGFQAVLFSTVGYYSAPQHFLLTAVSAKVYLRQFINLQQHWWDERFSFHRTFKILHNF